MTIAGDLYALQEIDTALEGRQRELAAIAEQLGAGDPTVTVRARVAERQAWLDAARVRAADIDTAIVDLNAKIAPVETKLYDGSVRNSRDLEALQKDLEMLQRQRQVLEEQQLAVMEEIEASVNALTEERQALRELEGAQSDERRELESRQRLGAEDIERLQGERVRRAERIDPARLRLYEHLRTIRRGRAVARMERGVCLGCRITLPTNIQQRARNPMTLVQCTSCERILFTG